MNRFVSVVILTFCSSITVAGVEISLDEGDAGAEETGLEEEVSEGSAKADNWRKLGGKGAGRVTGETVTLKAGEAVEASVPASERSKGFTFGFRAHGTGNLKVTFKAHTVYGNATPLVGKGENKEPLDLPLIACDRPYRIHAGKTPLGTKRCVLRIVAEGEAVLSGMELESVKTPPPKITEINRSQKTLPPGYVMGRELPISAGRADLAPFADCVAVNEFEIRLRAPVDGSFGTHRRGAFELRFPKEVSVDEIRLTLPQGDVLVYADCDGDGKHEQPLVEVAGDPAFGTWSDMPEYVWYVKRLEKPVRLRSLLVPCGAWEVRVIGDAAQLAGLPRPATLPEREPLRLGAKKDDPAPAAAKDALRFGFALEPWMFGAQNLFTAYDTKGTPVPPIREWKEWKRVLEDFRFYGANFVLLFPPSTFSMPKAAVKPQGAYPYPVLWPSDVWYINQPNEVLKDFNDSCHENGIECFVIPREWSFTSEKRDRPKQVVFAEEITQRGADGVPTCVDEHCFGFGLKPADTLEFRKEYLAKASKTAAWMAQIKDVASAVNPDALTFGGYAGCDHYKTRYAAVSGCDFWGFEGRVDVIGGDGTYYGVGDRPLATYTPAVETAVQLACTPKRLSMATLNCNWGTHWEGGRLKNPLVYDDYPSTAFKAGPLVTFFNKGTHANFWRYNYIVGNGGPNCREATAAGGRFVKILSSWGGKSASIPKDVLVLRSRTSEDWWTLRREDPELGFTLFFWTAARLCEGAVPFEIYSMQRVETWKDIAKGYKAIVLPFAYSVSDEEASALKAAADAGVRILAPGTYPFAATDGLGEKRVKSALDGVPVERYAFEAKPGRSTVALAEGFRARLRAALDARGGASLSLAREPDHDVQAYRLDAKDGSVLVAVVNWSERDTKADLKVRLPFAAGRLEVVSEDGLYDAPFADDVRIELPKEAVRMLRFSPDPCCRKADSDLPGLKK